MNTTSTQALAYVRRYFNACTNLPHSRNFKTLGIGILFLFTVFGSSRQASAQYVVKPTRPDWAESGEAWGAVPSGTYIQMIAPETAFWYEGGQLMRRVENMVVFGGQQASYRSSMYSGMGWQSHYLYIEAKVINPVPDGVLVYRFTNNHAKYFKNLNGPGDVIKDSKTVSPGAPPQESWRIKDDNVCIDRPNSRLTLSPLDKFPMPDFENDKLGNLWGKGEYDQVTVEISVEYHKGSATGKLIGEVQRVNFYLIRPKDKMRQITLTVNDSKQATSVNGVKYTTPRNCYLRETITFDFEEQPGYRPEVVVKSGELKPIERDAVGNRLYYTYLISADTEVDIKWEAVVTNIPLELVDPKGKCSMQGHANTGDWVFEGEILKVVVPSGSGAYSISPEGAEPVRDRESGLPIPNTFRVLTGASNVKLTVVWDTTKKYRLTIQDEKNATTVKGVSSQYSQSQSSPVFYQDEPFSVEVQNVPGYEIEAITVSPAAFTTQGGMKVYSATQDVVVSVRWRKVTFRTLRIEDDFSQVPWLTDTEKTSLQNKWTCENLPPLGTTDTQYSKDNQVKITLDGSIDTRKWKRTVVADAGLSQAGDIYTFDGTANGLIRVVWEALPIHDLVVVYNTNAVRTKAEVNLLESKTKVNTQQAASRPQAFWDGQAITIAVEDQAHYTWTAQVDIEGGASSTFSEGAKTVKATGKVTITIKWTEKPRYTLTLQDAEGKTAIKGENGAITPSSTPVFFPGESFTIEVEERPKVKTRTKVKIGNQTEDWVKGKKYIATGNVEVISQHTQLFRLEVENHNDKVKVNTNPYVSPMTLEDGARVLLTVDAPREEYTIEVLSGLTELSPQQENTWIIQGDAVVEIKWKAKYKLLLRGDQGKVKVNGKPYDPSAVFIEGSTIVLTIDAEPHEYTATPEQGLEDLEPQRPLAWKIVGDARITLDWPPFKLAIEDVKQLVKVNGQPYNPDSEYRKGDELEITVEPPQWWSYSIDYEQEWIKPHPSKENTWIIRGNAKMTIVWKELPRFSLEVTDPKGKTRVARDGILVAPSDPKDQKVLKPGDIITLHTDAVEYFSPRVSVTGAESQEVAGQMVYRVTGDVVVTVTWEEQPRYTLTVHDAHSVVTVLRDGETIAPSPHPVFKPGEEFTLKVPAVPYFTPTIQVEGAERREEDGVQIYTVTGDVVVTVTWEEQPRYTLTIEDEKGKTQVSKEGQVISPAPTPVFKPNAQIEVAVGEDPAFIPTVTVLGADKNTEGYYVVTGDVVVSVTWTEVPIALPELRVPAVFSPNGDGVNDTWEIPAKDREKRDLRGRVEVSNVRVYDRWGVTVLYVEKGFHGWDGRDTHGNELPTDSYYYDLTISMHGQSVQKRGTVTIVR